MSFRPKGEIPAYRWPRLWAHEEERFHVEQRRWVCSYRSRFRQHPLWVRLDILKEGYAPQDMYINVFKDARTDEAQEVRIDLGTVFLDRVPSEPDAK